MAAHPRPAREGLSVTTLIIAALASVTAAIVTSTFWKGGTIVTAAITPVIVAIMKELLARPIESDLVRRPVERLRTATSAPPVGSVSGGRRAGFEREPEPPALEPRRARNGYTAGDSALSAAPIRTYGRPRRNLRLRLALATAAIAFLIAVAVLTVPELLFGGSVTGSGRTTFFGGPSTHQATTTTTPSGTRTTTTSPQPSQSSTSSSSSSGHGASTAPSSGSQPATHSQGAPPASSGGGSGAPSGGSAPPSSGPAK